MAGWWQKRLFIDGQPIELTEDVLPVLVHRFGEVPAEVKAAIERLDLEQLERLFVVALAAAGPDARSTGRQRVRRR